MFCASSMVAEPKETVDKPKVTVDKPKVTVDKPKVTVDKPKETVDKPKVTVDKPKVTVDKPKVTVDKPKETVDKPKETVDKPKVNKPSNYYCDIDNWGAELVKMSRADICHPDESPYKIRHYDEVTLKTCLASGGRLPLVLQKLCPSDAKKEELATLASLETDARLEQTAENKAPFGFKFGPGFAVIHSSQHEQFYLSSSSILSKVESRTRMAPFLEAHYLWELKGSDKDSLLNRHGVFIAGSLNELKLGQEAPVWGIGYMIGLHDQISPRPLNIGFGLLFESNVTELKPEYSLGMTVDGDATIDDMVSNTGDRTSVLIMLSVQL